MSVIRRHRVIFTIAAMGFGLRLCGAFFPFWLDEILSLKLVENLQHSWQIWSQLKVDNNHPLTSLWIFLVGPGKAEVVYRFPSIACGALTPIAAAWAAKRMHEQIYPQCSECESRWTAWSAAIIFSFAYLFTVQSTETRGYAPLTFFLLIAWGLLVDHPTAKLRRVYAFHAAFVIATLFHAMAVSLLPALLLLLVSAWRRRSSEPGLAKKFFFRWCAFPIGFLALYYLFFLSQMRVIGGEERDAWKAIGRAAVALFGGDLEQGAWLGLMMVVVPAIFGLAQGWRTRSPHLLAALGSMVAIPLCLALWGGEIALYPRYFTANAVFAGLLVAVALGTLIRAGAVGRIGCVVVLSGIAAANLSNDAIFLKKGRGNPSRILNRILQTKDLPPILGSNFDYGCLPVVDHYALQFGPLAVDDSAPISYRELHYVTEHYWKTAAPTWVIFVELGSTETLPWTVMNDPFGNKFQLVETIGAAPLAGMTWSLYQRVKGDR